MSEQHTSTARLYNCTFKCTYVDKQIKTSLSHSVSLSFSLSLSVQRQRWFVNCLFSFFCLVVYCSEVCEELIACMRSDFCSLLSMLHGCILDAVRIKRPWRGMSRVCDRQTRVFICRVQSACGELTSLRPNRRYDPDNDYSLHIVKYVTASLNLVVFVVFSYKIMQFSWFFNISSFLSGGVQNGSDSRGRRFLPGASGQLVLKANVSAFNSVSYYGVYEVITFWAEQ